MTNADLQSLSGCYFSLPRLLMKWAGMNSRKTESNPVEAHVVGLGTFGISFLFLAHVLPDDQWWMQLTVSALILFATFLFWIVALYLTSLAGKLLRGGGWLAGVSESRAQVISVVALTTFFALCLITTESWIRFVGATWIIAVSLNLIAAVLLVGSRTDDPVS